MGRGGSALGEVQLAVDYVYRRGMLEICVKQCRDIAPVDLKHNVSNPYVKLYLLPEKTKAGKRKTRVKKGTLCPVFNEKFTYEVPKSALAARTLWVSVWHAERVGRREFLGDVALPLSDQTFNDSAPHWHKLQQEGRGKWKSVLSLVTQGELDLALRRVQLGPPTQAGHAPREELHVTIRQARGLASVRSSAHSAIYCKCRLLPDQTKHKTPAVKHDSSPSWNHTFVFAGVTSRSMTSSSVASSSLAGRCLEVTVWEQGRLRGGALLGGIRLNTGTGQRAVQGSGQWSGEGAVQGLGGSLSASVQEGALWQGMLERPGEWLEASLPLRPSVNLQGSTSSLTPAP